jgi:C4-dicarboxylate-specific signal transduction histidine kinase
MWSQLIANACEGLDLSPGDPVAAWAVAEIERLTSRLAVEIKFASELLEKNERLRAENEELRHDLERSMANHVADINDPLACKDHGIATRAADETTVTRCMDGVSPTGRYCMLNSGHSGPCVFCDYK